MYSGSVRGATKTENPDVADKMAQISKIIGAKWKALTEAERQTWNAKSKKDKEAHEAIHGKTVRKTKVAKEAKGPKAAKAGKAAKADGPKRPTSAYFYYSNETRKSVAEANPGMPVSEIAKVLGAQWKELTDDVKKPCELDRGSDKCVDCVDTTQKNLTLTHTTTRVE